MMYVSLSCFCCVSYAKSSDCFTPQHSYYLSTQGFFFMVFKFNSYVVDVLEIGENGIPNNTCSLCP